MKYSELSEVYGSMSWGTVESNPETPRISLDNYTEIPKEESSSEHTGPSSVSMEQQLNCKEGNDCTVLIEHLNDCPHCLRKIKLKKYSSLFENFFAKYDQNDIVLLLLLVFIFYVIVFPKT